MMSDLAVYFDGVSAAAMTREFQQKALGVEGVAESSLQRTPVPPGEKSAVGDTVGALLKLASQKAVGPVIDLVTHFLTRDKRAKIKFKLGDREVEMEFVNMDAKIGDLRRLLLDVVQQA